MSSALALLGSDAAMCSAFTPVRFFREATTRSAANRAVLSWPISGDKGPWPLLERRAGPGVIEPSAPGEARGHSPQRAAYFANGLLIAGSILASILVAERCSRLLPRFPAQTSQGEFVFRGSLHVRHQPHPTFGLHRSSRQRLFRTLLWRRSMACGNNGDGFGDTIWAPEHTISRVRHPPEISGRIQR